MYRASAERNTGVKYLSLSSRDNARANWNLLGASSKKGVTSPSLRSLDRFTLILLSEYYITRVSRESIFT